MTAALLIAHAHPVRAQTAGQVPGQPAPGQPSTTPRTPPRAGRPGEDPAKGTAIMRGYVVAADSAAPLRRATVRVSASDGRSGGMTTTDADGRFEVKELPAGRYSVSVTKAGYVTMQYGQRRPEQQGTMLEILDGQLVEKIAFALPRGGVIVGRVLDEFGEPMASVQVNAMRSRFVNGGRRLVPSGGAQTDDLGAFRIFGLAPGDYFVSGSLRSQSMMMMPGSATVTNVEGYAPTYYPGTPNAGEAQRVTVKVGAETTNVAFSLAATRLVRVSGRVVSASGEPAMRVFLMANMVDRSTVMGMTGFSNAMTGVDGRFQLNGLAPGTYNVVARPQGMPSADAEFGQMRVTVGSDDVDNVLIVTGRGATARGIVTADDNTAPPFRPQLISLFARPFDPDVMNVTGGEGKVNDDWNFEMTGLSDRRVLTANVAENPDWMLKNITLNGVDITDTPLEFVPGQVVEGLHVVLTRKRTELSGNILDAGSRPDTDATVIAFAQDSKRWTAGSRFIRTARTNQDGRYNLRGLPPEDYFVVAIRDIEPGEWQDPEVLESLRDVAVRVSFTEGETKVQDLKTARRPGA
jgi:hypothetical protein